MRTFASFSSRISMLQSTLRERCRTNSKTTQLSSSVNSKISEIGLSIINSCLTPSCRNASLWQNSSKTLTSKLSRQRLFQSSAWKDSNDIEEIAIFMQDSLTKSLPSLLRTDQQSKSWKLFSSSKSLSQLPGPNLSQLSELKTSSLTMKESTVFSDKKMQKSIC